MFATAATFLKNFSIPCLWVAMGAGLLAGGTGFWAGKRWAAGDVAEARNDTLRVEKALSDYRTTVATATSSALTIGFARQTEATAAVSALRDEIVTSLAKGHAELLKAVKTRSDTFRSATDETKYECLSVALPDSALRVYERPGGSSTPAATD